MNNISLIYPEIFISLSVMFLLILGVFKKNSLNLVYNLSIASLIGTLILIFNYPIKTETNLFNDSYRIDYLSTFMKILTLISAAFVLIISSRFFLGNQFIFSLAREISANTQSVSPFLLLHKLIFIFSFDIS